MRIAIFTDSYKPEISGVVTSIVTLRTELLRIGHEVFLFAPRYHGKVTDDATVVEIPSVPFPFRKARERRMALPWGGGALRKFRRLNIDVIHSHVPGTVGIYALIAGCIHRVPHVHTYHTDFLKYTHYAPLPRAFSTRFVKWFVRHFCGRCQHVITPGRGMKDGLRDLGVDAPVSVVPTGIDADTKRPRKTAKDLFSRYSLGDPASLAGKRVLVSIGRLGSEKNIDFLLRALGVIRDRHNVHLLLIGDGPDRRELENSIRELDLAGRVTLTGYVSHQDVFSFLALAELFIFASVTETQGLVLLESMAAGTPVVAVAGNGVSDLLEGNTGGIVTAPREEDFAAAIDTMLSDEELRQRKSKEAVDRAREWSVEMMVSRIVRIYVRSIRDFRSHGQPRLHHRRGRMRETPAT